MCSMYIYPPSVVSRPYRFSLTSSPPYDLGPCPCLVGRKRQRYFPFFQNILYPPNSRSRVPSPNTVQSSNQGVRSYSPHPQLYFVVSLWNPAHSIPTVPVNYNWWIDFSTWELQWRCLSLYSLFGVQIFEAMRVHKVLSWTILTSWFIWTQRIWPEPYLQGS